MFVELSLRSGFKEVELELDGRVVSLEDVAVDEAADELMKEVEAEEVKFVFEESDLDNSALVVESIDVAVKLEDGTFVDFNSTRSGFEVVEFGEVKLTALKGVALRFENESLEFTSLLVVKSGFKVDSIVDDELKVVSLVKSGVEYTLKLVGLVKSWVVDEAFVVDS